MVNVVQKMVAVQMVNAVVSMAIVVLLTNIVNPDANLNLENVFKK